MSNIHDIPTEEAIKDLLETATDIEMCKLALQMGITHDGTFDVRYRLDKNIEIAETIRNELVLRSQDAATKFAIFAFTGGTVT